MSKEKYPEGHFLGLGMGIGIAIFSAIGISLSIITENPGMIGIGPALGVAIGVAIGQSLENKYKEQGKLRPLTQEEKKRKKNAVYAGIVILILGIIAFLSLFLMRGS